MSLPTERSMRPIVLVVSLCFLAIAIVVMVRMNIEESARDAAANATPPPLPDDEGPDTWRRHPFDEGLPGVSEPHARAPDVAVDAEPDPQQAAMRRSFGIRGDAGVELPFYPITFSARLTAARGIESAVGDRCEVRVLPVRAGPHNCLVRVSCGEEILYPEPALAAGYVPCELDEGRPIRARDTGSTHEDGDPKLDLDLRAYEARVEDEGSDRRAAFSARLSIRRPEARPTVD